VGCEVDPSHTRLMMRLRIPKTTAGLRLLVAAVFVAMVAACGTTERSDSSSRIEATTAGSTVGPVTASVSRTAVNTFAPWSQTGKLGRGITVGRRVRGSCWEASMAVELRGAYRCASGNIIYDPCFAFGDGASGELVCALSPWGKVILMRLTKPLPRATTNPGNPLRQPWALQLSNGVNCLVDTGTPGYADGLYFTYYCGNAIRQAGNLDKSYQPWSVEYDPTINASVFHTVNVTAVWD
jgi:hypothetical protein